MENSTISNLLVPSIQEVAWDSPWPNGRRLQDGCNVRLLLLNPRSLWLPPVPNNLCSVILVYFLQVGCTPVSFRPLGNLTTGRPTFGLSGENHHRGWGGWAIAYMRSFAS